MFDRVKDRVPQEIHGMILAGVNERLRCYEYLPGHRFAPHSDGAFIRNDDERSWYIYIIYLNEEFESFYIADRAGWAQVITAPDEEFNHFNLAAAIAVIKASCGWDESSSIVVTINNAEVRVWPRFDGQQWIAEDREETYCEGLSERTFLR